VYTSSYSVIRFLEEFTRMVIFSFSIPIFCSKSESVLKLFIVSPHPGIKQRSITFVLGSATYMALFTR